MPVEIVVGVEPPLISGPLGGERCCQGKKGLVEVAINDGSLGGCVDRTGRPGLRSPAELMSIAGVLFLEPPMDVTEVAKLLEGGGGRRLSTTCSMVSGLPCSLCLQTHHVVKRVAIGVTSNFFETKMIASIQQSINRLSGYFFVLWCFNKRRLKAGILTF